MKKTTIGTAGAEVTRARFLKGLGAFGVAAASGGVLCVDVEPVRADVRVPRRDLVEYTP